MPTRARRRPSPQRRARARAAREGVGEVLELRIGEPAHGGACVARDASGRVVFVRHTLPGERVRARVTSVRNTLAWADAIEILDASADRVSPVWPQAGPSGVGGGELSHVVPPAQRRWKEHVIAGQIRRVGGEALAEAVDAIGGVRVAPAPGDGEPGDRLAHRRNRIEFVIGTDGAPGMHVYRGKRLIPLDSMPLAAPAIAGLGLFDGDSPWKRVWAPGERVRALSPTPGSAYVVCASGVYGADARRTGSAALAWPVEIGGEEHVYGVRPTGFWQTHVRGAQVLAEEVLDAARAETGGAVLELYSGAGLFTAPLARAVGKGGRLASLEGDEGAVADAADNLAPFPWAQTFIGGIDAQGVAELAGGLGRAPDVVVADPPRAGAGRQVCEAMAALGAPRLVLVSCDPAAGARDLRALAGAGYRLESLRAWDLFPHTHHVEIVAALTRA